MRFSASPGALALLLAIAALGPPASAAAPGEAFFPVYPAAGSPMEQWPAGVKIGSGTGWSRLRWSSWGGSEAVARGRYFDHPGTPVGFATRGRLRLWRPVACGPFRLYTRMTGRLRGGRRDPIANAVTRYRPRAASCRLGFPTNLAQSSPQDEQGGLAPAPRPERVHLTLDSALFDLRWSAWGGPTATATGVAGRMVLCRPSDYVPDCETEGPVTVTLGKLGWCPTYPPFPTYMRIAFSDAATVLGESGRDLRRVCR